MDETRFQEVYQAFSSMGAGWALAFVFAELDAQGEAKWTSDPRVPYVQTENPPDAEYPGWRDKVWVKISGGAWVKASTIATVTALGVGAPGTPVSGIYSGNEMHRLGTVAIGIGLLVLSVPLITAINALPSTDILVVPTYASFDPVEYEAQTAIRPDAPFTAAEVAKLAAWLASHGVTGAQFGAWFGMTAQQVSTWMQANTRLEFAVAVYGRFTE